MIITWLTGDDPDIQRLCAAQQRELAAMAPADQVAYALHDEIEFALATRDGEPVACAALQRLSPTEAEVKRMYVLPGARRAGLARQILAAVEQRAAARGYTSLYLETGRRYPAAIGLYESSGYARVPAYGEYAGDPHSVCFTKAVTPAPIHSDSGIPHHSSPAGN